MSDITLKSGRVVKIDASEITRKEWNEFISPNSSKAYEDSIITKYTGLTEEELDALPMRDFNRIIKTFVKDVQAPDPS